MSTMNSRTCNDHSATNGAKPVALQRLLRDRTMRSCNGFGPVSDSETLARRALTCGHRAGERQAGAARIDAWPQMPGNRRRQNLQHLSVGEETQGHGVGHSHSLTRSSSRFSCLALGLLPVAGHACSLPVADLVSGTTGRPGHDVVGFSGSMNATRTADLAVAPVARQHRRAPGLVLCGSRARCGHLRPVHWCVCDAVRAADDTLLAVVLGALLRSPWHQVSLTSWAAVAGAGFEPTTSSA